MPDETKRIEATLGPYAGSHLDLPSADAEQAIADGWARDPYAAPDPNAGTPAFDQEKHDKTMVAAEKAARKLRGEPEPEEHEKARKSAAKNETRTSSMEADTTGKGYETRATTTKKGK